jgi:hypothetical protein
MVTAVVSWDLALRWVAPMTVKDFCESNLRCKQQSEMSLFPPLLDFNPPLFFVFTAL